MISFISFSNTNITKKHPRVKFSRASRDKRGHKRGVYLQNKRINDCGAKFCPKYALIKQKL